jgi:hypothetical protein
MKCQFCKKEFKTQSGYDKHMCVKKSRYVNFNVLAFYVWKSWNKLVHLKLSTDDEKNKIRFIGCKEYLIFEKFASYLNEIQPYDCYDYLEYLVKHNIKPNKWCSSDYFHKWVIDYDQRENKNLGIIRSKKYMENNNLDIQTVSESRLFNLLWNGRISPYYIDYIDRNIFFKLGDDLLKKLEPIINIILK